MDLASRRVERKYRLPDATADQWRARLAGTGLRVEQARITTVYLDRHDGLLTRAAAVDPGHCVKLRLRTYEGPVADVVWAELKERHGAVSTKVRFPIPAARVAAFLEGADAGPLDRLRLFRAAAPGPLRPVGAVRCTRLAVEGGEPRARLTVDLGVTYHPGPSLEPGLAAGREPGVVVEVKSAGAVPAWCRALLDGREACELSKFAALVRLRPAPSAKAPLNCVNG